MNISIIDEIKISLFKPHKYNELKNESIFRIILFQGITVIISMLFLIVSQLLISIFTGKFSEFKVYLMGFTFKNALITASTMFLDIMLVTLIISFIFKVAAFIRKSNKLSFKVTFNYIAHSLLICSLFNRLFGPFVIMLVLSYYLMATKENIPDVRHLQKNNKSI
ncbi:MULTISPECIES: hypothetical protein [Clostridium]|uniref:hypothetical protein n=1 Tax=Clostridium TaxID=1485 RepID=UPI000824FF9C|nr:MULTISPECIES: hypothetical protein [Clostridium]PJI10201.1 hypothetical protein CUB90_21015 [Clostridium sp. CT7]